MALNANLLRRPTDRNLFLAAAILFPLLVLTGYFKSYYFSAFFPDAQPIVNAIVHTHGLVMSAWVLYFTMQIVLVRTKNVKLHMTLGMVGIGLAALVVAVGLLTAYDSHIVRQTAPPGMSPYSFMIVPLGDLLLFAIFFGGAILYRGSSVEHKGLMLLTAINFMPPALARLPFIPPDYFLVVWLGGPTLTALGALLWLTMRHRKFNKILALGVFLLVASYPLRLVIGFSEGWINLMARIFS